jgi:hypothetical protein
MKPAEPGDLCFLDYVGMVERFRGNPRWTTIHNEFKRLTGFDDKQAARALAFMVYFIKFAMPYEYEKIEENGDI